MTHLQGSEKNLTYLKNLEKHKAESKIIHKLNIGGNTIVDQNEITNEQKRYYQSLYHKRGPGRVFRDIGILAKKLEG